MKAERLNPDSPKPFDRRVAKIPLGAVAAPVEIDNPFRLPGESADRIIVMRNMRGDPLAWMHSHERIGDAEYLAGRRWQEYYERSQMGGVKALDTLKEPVDGGGIYGEPVTDGQRRASRLLRLASAVLETSVPGDRNRGSIRVALVYLILGLGLFPGQVAEIRGEHSRYQIEKVSKEFCRSLEVLAGSFGWQG